MANELTTDIKGSKTSVAEEREHQISLMARRITEIPSDLQQRFAYNADLTILYAGYGAKGLAASSTGWLLHKFTYDANQQVTLRQSAFDSWDNRASATYE